MGWHIDNVTIYGVCYTYEEILDFLGKEKLKELDNEPEDYPLIVVVPIEDPSSEEETKYLVGVDITYSSIEQIKQLDTKNIDKEIKECIKNLSLPRRNPSMHYLVSQYQYP